MVLNQCTLNCALLNFLLLKRLITSAKLRNNLVHIWAGSRILVNENRVVDCQCHIC